MLEVDNLVGKGVTSKFPYVWLRDNCLCHSCFHSKSSSRLTSFANLDLDDRVVHCKSVHGKVQDTRLGRHTRLDPVTGPSVQHSEEEQECLRLVWSSGHESSFPVRWLQERCFSNERQAARSIDMDIFALLESSGFGASGHAEGGAGTALAAAVRASAVPVGASGRESQCRTIPRFAFADLVASDEAMLGWCHAMEKYGVAIVKTDNSSGMLKEFTQLFGFREWCSYGEFYLVENKQTPPAAAGEAIAPQEQANNLAYTGLPLQFHTDLPHYSSPPQVQLLHCIEQCSCEGGANKFVDGFAVAEHLRAHHPEAFRLLTTVKMEYARARSHTHCDRAPLRI